MSDLERAAALLPSAPILGRSRAHDMAQHWANVLHRRVYYVALHDAGYPGCYRLAVSDLAPAAHYADPQLWTEE